jgi:PPP family 3-phenylpropionic acid transporter
MQAVLRDGLDYGRIRLCGSVTFMAGTLLGGLLLRAAGAPWVLYSVIAALAATLIACLRLPSDIRRRPQGPFWGGFHQLLRLPAFVVFLGAGALLQGSHALYYGFSSLHWQSAGLSATTIGLLWALGVLAEILLFAFAGKALAGMSTARLLAVAGLAGILRWSILGASTAPPLLIAAQLLHAGTFGAAHLAAVHHIAKVAMPHGLGGTAQSLYAAASGGLIIGLLLLASGPLYAGLGGAGFYVMAGVSAGGLLLAGLFARLAR